MSSPLSKYFTGVGIKRLTQVEKANQHELNGVSEFRKLFGSERRKFNTKFIFLSDDEDKVKEQTGILTWYDARENHKTRTEFRLYYSTNEIIESAQIDDLIIVAQVDNDNLALITCSHGSTSEKQLLWLFGQADIRNDVIVRDLTTDTKDLGFAGKYILSTFGFTIEETLPETLLDDLLEKFGRNFPSTREFSAYARASVDDQSPLDSPDETIVAWIEREELLFKTLEKLLISEKLLKGFGKDGTDVDEFIKFSLSIQNRRKSRAGYSFENNLEALFIEHQVFYSKGASTERNNKPDFIFPGIKQYKDSAFDAHLLTMLGVKTTAKDRWRQILAEAARIPNKYLITLEPAISRNQTEEMKANRLQLVIPTPLHSTYALQQQGDIINLKQFIRLVLEKQERYNKVNLLF